MTTAIDLSNVPVPLSRLVLGAMTFGESVDRTGAEAMLDMAREAGVTGVDTGNIYAGGDERTIRDLLTEPVELQGGSRTCARSSRPDRAAGARCVDRSSRGHYLAAC